MADRSGYIGRAPGDSSVVVARQVFKPTGIQTNFTFSSGYNVGYLDAYINGVKQIKGEDYTASDGSVVAFGSNQPSSGDVVELVAYKAFNVGNVTNATGNFTVGGDLTVTGDSTFSGTLTGDGSGLTGVASTDYIITGTAATFNNQVQIGVALTIGYAGVATFSGAGGIGVTITPSTGKIEATEYYGDGSNLEGISAGLGTALGSEYPLASIFKISSILSIGAGTSVTVESDASSGHLAFMRESDIHVGSGATFHIAGITTLVPDVLNIFNVT